MEYSDLIVLNIEKSHGLNILSYVSLEQIIKLDKIEWNLPNSCQYLSY